MSKYVNTKKKNAVQLLQTRYYKMINIKNLVVIDNLGIDSDTDLSQMTDELIENSILSPISVVGPFKNGTYKIIDGARRYKAFKNIDDSVEIPCYVVGDETTDEKKAKLLALSANRVKRNNDNSICMKYMEILNEEAAMGSIEKREISGIFSELTGLTPRQGRKYHTIVDNGCDEIKEALASSDITLDDAYTIVNNYRDDEDVQKEYLVKCQNTEWGNKGILKKEIEGKVPAYSNNDIPEYKRREYQKKIFNVREALMQLYIDETITSEDVKELTKICKKFYKKFKN